MRQNRRRYAKTSPVNHRVVMFISIMGLIVAVGALAMLSLKSTSAKIGSEISRLEGEYKTLRAERMRAEARWSACARPEQLDAALARHGLKMTLARGERIVSLKGGAGGAGGFVQTEVAANGTVSRK